MKKKISILFLCFVFLGVTSVEAKVSEKRARGLINDFVKALLIRDVDRSSKQVRKYVHHTLLSADGTDLSRNVKSYSFLKAYRNAHVYEYPVKIVRQAQTKITAIGYGKEAEAGEVHIFYIKPKKVFNQMPAPVHVFFPRDGGKPKIVNMGGL